MQKKTPDDGLARLWLRLRKKNDDSPRVAHIRRFCLRYGQVLTACEVLLPGEGAQLARRYMRQVLAAEHDSAWWAENECDLAQPWFIWQYACGCNLVEPPLEEKPQLELHPIQPEGGGTATVLLVLERSPHQADQGLIYLHCAQTDLPPDTARKLRCKPIPGGYVRKVEECAAPIMDRAVQTALGLLRQGYAVCVQEKTLHRCILREEYVPEHLYWVRAADKPEWLRLTYPYDGALHQYLLQMGGRWTGKQMLLPVTASQRLKDIVRLYGFRMTGEAQRRLVVWEDACQQTTIFRARRTKVEPPQPAAVDQFRQMLQMDAVVPADLIDPADG